MTNNIFGTLILAAALALSAQGASAAPTLKGDIVVTGDVVTIGDMFADAGALSDHGLFRSPAPGTAGTVGIEAVRKAAGNAGLPTFDDEGIAVVRVARSGVAVDNVMLTRLLQDDLKRRGIVSDDMTVQADFDAPLGALEAATTSRPVQLLTLQYAPGNPVFSARFLLAGHQRPLDVSGRITLMVPAPQLVNSLPAGSILGAGDVEMRMVPLQVAQSAGPADLDQLVGKQLTRQTRAGMMLRPSDVTDPTLISRNEPVTVYLHAGSMTLSVKGQALNEASLGQPVAVLNTTSKKILHGTAVSPGAVEIGTDPITVAGL